MAKSRRSYDKVMPLLWRTYDEVTDKDGNVAQELHQNVAVLVLRYLFERQLANFEFFFESSNGRLPPEHGSDRRETLAKRVSDDLQLFIFRP